MQQVHVSPSQRVVAALTGEQRFEGGGSGSVVRVNGNPFDYRLTIGAEPTEYRLAAVNGTGTFVFSPAIEKVEFVSGAFCLVSNLAAVIPRNAPVWGRAPEPFISYAQIEEDVLLFRALRHVDPAEGFYVDAGAYLPDTDTVTRLFYERGWRGLNIEPAPELHAALVAARPRDINVAVAASSGTGEQSFFRNDGEQLGTLEERFAFEDAQRVTVPTATIADLLDQHGIKTVHFLKIDVEGHERAVLEGCDLSRHRPWIIMVEACVPNQSHVPTFGEWEDILNGAGYLFAAADELNRYYVAKEHPDLVPCFAVPVDRYFTSRDVEGRHRLERELADLREQLARRADLSPPARSGLWSVIKGWIG